MRTIKASVTIIRQYNIVSDIEATVQVPDDATDATINDALEAAAKDEASVIAVDDGDDAYPPTKMTVEKVDIHA